jgi:hypothetical protein
VIKKNKDPNQHYDGYAGCPILVGGKKVMLAEFKYDLKKDFFPAVYWHVVPKGIWAGKKGIKLW